MSSDAELPVIMQHQFSFTRNMSPCNAGHKSQNDFWGSSSQHRYTCSDQYFLWLVTMQTVSRTTRYTFLVAVQENPSFETTLKIKHDRQSLFGEGFIYSETEREGFFRKQSQMRGGLSPERCFISGSTVQIHI